MAFWTIREEKAKIEKRNRKRSIFK